jgi:hypothetical protein
MVAPARSKQWTPETHSRHHAFVTKENGAEIKRVSSSGVSIRARITGLHLEEALRFSGHRVRTELNRAPAS